jgi:hypothetical protein
MKIENDVDVIAFMVRRLQDKHKYLFVFGGTGAGHEDVTLPAVAKAFGTGMERHPELLRLVIECIGAPNITEWHLKMADVPFGSDIIAAADFSKAGEEASSRAGVLKNMDGPVLKNKDGPVLKNKVLQDWPIVKKNNCFIMSARHRGPDLTRRLDSLRPFITSPPVFITTVKLLLENSELVSAIAELDSRHPSVRVLSYCSSEVLDPGEVGSGGGGGGGAQGEGLEVLNRQKSVP